jgi:glutamyl-tRNA synthetase
MDWGNAFVRSKSTGPSGEITSITMELHLDGDFRKTKKKVTWLPQPTGEHTLIDITLLDYDYIITKKKLEENDDVKDFVTPVTEFREEAVADANVRELQKGDIIQFERKGYYIFDGSAGERLQFIHIPDGRAASLASKAGVATPGESGKTSEPVAAPLSKTFDTPVETKMYEVSKVYGDDTEPPPVATKMYEVHNVYDS